MRILAAYLDPGIYLQIWIQVWISRANQVVFHHQ